MLFHVLTTDHVSTLLAAMNATVLKNFKGKIVKVKVYRGPLFWGTSL